MQNIDKEKMLVSLKNEHAKIVEFLDEIANNSNIDCTIYVDCIECPSYLRNTKRCLPFLLQQIHDALENDE